MAGDVGELHGKRRLEITVEELVVASAHARRGDLQENLVRLGLGHGNLFDPKRFLVSVHSGCSHLHVRASFSIVKKSIWSPSRQTQTARDCLWTVFYPDGLGIYKSMRPEMREFPAVAAVLDSTH